MFIHFHINLKQNEESENGFKLNWALQCIRFWFGSLEVKNPEQQLSFQRICGGFHGVIVLMKDDAFLEGQELGNKLDGSCEEGGERMDGGGFTCTLEVEQ